MQTKEHSNSTVEKYNRYFPIIELIVSQPNFEIDGIKRACPDERPAFVTRLVNELVDQGWLIRESDQTSVRWNSGRGDFSPTKWLDEKLFGKQLKATPEQERPRERLLNHGVEQLRTSELLAILIRSGRPGESAMIAGEKLAKKFGNRLEDLPMAGRGELKAISCAVEKTAFCQIKAGIELGRRIAAVNGARLPVRLR